jgi:hypothetical protein
MSTLATTNIKHPSSASNNIVLDSAGGVDLDALTVSGSAPADSVNIDASGKLLVGTSTSEGNMAVAPQVQLEGTTVDGSTSAIKCNGGTTATNGSRLYLNRSRGTALTSRTVVAAGDTLGTIFFGGADGANIQPAASIAGFVDDTPGAGDMPGRIVLATTADGASSPTERMRIGSSDVNNKAFVSIRSTTVPHTDNCTLYVRCAATGSFSGITLQDGGGDLVNRDFLRFYDYLNNKVGAIYRSGSSTVYATSSDYRLKENVVPLSNALSRLMSVSVHRFNFIAHPDTTVDGFLAHEIQTVVPEAVGGEKDAVDSDGNPLYQCIDQSKLVPLLTAALQEAIGEIESLKARVAALESA